MPLSLPTNSNLTFKATEGKSTQKELDILSYFISENKNAVQPHCKRYNQLMTDLDELQ